MRKILFALLVLTAACGGSPTEPTQKPQLTVKVEAVQPEPAPLPAPLPEPTPEPPAPVPVPPVPAPSPDEMRFAGQVEQAHWWGPAVFLGHFELVIYWDHVEASGHGFDILSKAPGNVYLIAGTRNVEALTIEYHGPTDGSGQWTWTYNGLPGQATGSLVRR
jgi:hypothetical protein